MPLKLNGPLRVVHCVNEHLPGHELQPGESSTMIMNTRWFAVPAIAPPQNGVPPNLDLSYVAPARLFYCRACGYMEMYSAMVVDAATWQSARIS
jgi:hypothetical protein